MKTYRLQRRFYECIVEDLRCFAVGNVVRGACFLRWVGTTTWLVYTWLGQIATNVPPVVSAHDVVASFVRDVVGGMF